MTALYIICLAIGAPLVVWFAFSGGDADGAGADADADGGVFSLIPLSTVAFFMAFFGMAGLVTQFLGAGAFGSLFLALALGGAAGLLNSAAFAWLRNNEVSSEVTDRELEGSIAMVSLPVSTERRGRIVLDVAGSRTQMTAQLTDGDEELREGDRVIIVRVDSGVALVTRLDIELE